MILDVVDGTLAVGRQAVRLAEEERADAVKRPVDARSSKTVVVTLPGVDTVSSEALIPVLAVYVRPTRHSCSHDMEFKFGMSVDNRMGRAVGPGVGT